MLRCDTLEGKSARSWRELVPERRADLSILEAEHKPPDQPSNSTPAVD
jgi:hypothetical protein